MKKILVILGGGRPKGNTRQLVNAFAQGAMDAGHDVEIISLNKVEVKGCIGCNACRYGKPCVQKDGFNGLVPKIKAADLIVFASPLLFWTISSKLKAFIERFYCIAAVSYTHLYACNAEDAMDIVQEGACRAIAAAEQLKYPRFADTWVYRIMINTAREFLRRNRREVTAGEELPEEGREDTYEETDLYRALQQLDEKERTIVICKYFEDMTLDEIADTEKENVNTVKSRLYRALKKLRVYLEEPAGSGSSRTGKRGSFK